MYVNLRGLCFIMAAGSILCGGLGMAASFLFLSSAVPHENIAGASGFVAGAILIASGMMTFAIAASANPRPVDDSKRVQHEDFHIRQP